MQNNSNGCFAKGGILMTAEIGILNKGGVALAADSAVTVCINGREKVLNSANKLFMLSKYHPVGIMIYGNATFMGTPWEIIIKIYRDSLEDQPFKTLKEYSKNFMDFLVKDGRFNSSISEKTTIKSIFAFHLKDLLNSVNDIIYEKFKTKEPSDSEVEELLNLQADEFLGNIDNKYNFLGEYNSENFEMLLKDTHTSLSEVIDGMIKIDLNNDLKMKLIRIGNLVISKDIFSSLYSGVVVAGYGENDIFPTIEEYYIEGLISNNLKYKINNITKISAEVSDDTITSAIVPFAQQDMVQTFIRGMDNDLKGNLFGNIELYLNNYSNFIQEWYKNNNIEHILSQDEIGVIDSIGREILKTLSDNFNKLQYTEHIEPVIDMIDMLNKEDLAAMAESLVSLTSLKRKVTIEAESVGGPIDVAVITKGDGFIWIKRKHYFKPELNYNFFNNYIRSDKDD